MGFAAFRDLISFLVVNKAAPESDDDDDDDVAMGGGGVLSFSFPSSEFDKRFTPSPPPFSSKKRSKITRIRNK